MEFGKHSSFRFEPRQTMLTLGKNQQQQKKSNKMTMSKLMIVGVCAVVCLAALVQAQYNTYDSDSNSDSDENPILAKAELGKLVRNSAKHQSNARHNINTNQQYQQQLAAATRNLYNRQQPMQYAANNRRQYGGNGAELNGFGPMMGANARGAANGYGQANNEANDDGESSAFGPNFNNNGNSNSNNNDDDDGSSAEGGAQPMNLNQAASGYPGMGQGDYGNSDAGAAGFNFGGVSGYGPSADGSEFGPSGDAFSGEGRRQKSASSPSGSRNYGSDDDLAGALQYGPNSAINAGGDGEEDSRAGYAPEGQNDNDNDDE